MRRILAPSALLLLGVLAACSDAPDPTAAPDVTGPLAAASLPPQAAARAFQATSPEVMALDGAVYAVPDDGGGQIVFGFANRGQEMRVRAIMNRAGVSSTSYRIVDAEPIRMMQTSLRSVFRPVVAGVQINFGGFVCTLGFNAEHSDGRRSFITNSHCTDVQGGTEGTRYFQSLSSNSEQIATEFDDPSYVGSLPGCSAGKLCRYSDASRAVYASETPSSLGIIAKTTGVNNGSLSTAGNFTITSQDAATTSFPTGLVVNKVGRTTGWTAGTVSGTCATVNVADSNLQLICQTLVESPSRRVTIVGGGDSGSGVFTRGSTDDVELVGILWGGNISGSLFVFSPLKQVLDELGSFVATTASTGGGGGGGGEEPPPEPCVPKGKGNNCK